MQTAVEALTRGCVVSFPRPRRCSGPDFEAAVQCRPPQPKGQPPKGFIRESQCPTRPRSAFVPLKHRHPPRAMCGVCGVWSATSPRVEALPTQEAAVAADALRSSHPRLQWTGRPSPVFPHPMRGSIFRSGLECLRVPVCATSSFRTTLLGGAGRR